MQLQPFRYALDLQLFSEGDAGGGDAGGGDYGGGDYGGGTPAPAAPAATNPLLDDAYYSDDPAPAASAVEELDFAGRKVPVVDPIIRDLHRDYLNLNRTFQETQQTARALQEQNQVYQQMVQLFQQQQGQPQAQAPQVTGPSPEDVESFMNQWYENPMETVQQLIQRQVQQIVEPIQKERQYTQEVQQLSQRYTDFQQHIPVMQQLIQQNPRLAEQGLETVYFVARGQQTTNYTPDQLLNDPQFRQQLLKDEKLRSEIVGSYMQQRQQTNQQTPPVMGTQPGGSAPAAPENRPKSIREASKMWARSLGIGQ